jgi:hypothetical protein
VGLEELEWVWRNLSGSEGTGVGLKELEWVSRN